MKCYILVIAIIAASCNQKKISKEGDPVELTSLGNRSFELNLLDSAIYYYSTSIFIDSSICENYVKRGICYNKKNKYLLATSDFLAALKLNCDGKASIHNNLGYSLVMTHQPDLALLEFNKAIDLDDKNYVYYLNRGRCKLSISPPDLNGMCLDYYQAVDLNDTIRIDSYIDSLCSSIY